LAKGRIAVLSPLAVENEFVRSWHPRLIHGSLYPHETNPTQTHSQFSRFYTAHRPRYIQLYWPFLAEKKWQQENPHTTSVAIGRACDAA